ncbi:MAG: glycosyltransferase family 39 protein, partial [Pirellulales bacterium]
MVVLATHAAICIDNARQHCCTFDEGCHLAAGLVYWCFGDVDAYSVNPPLMKALAALPALAAGPEFPKLRMYDDIMATHDRFVRANSERYADILFAARLAVVAASAIGGWIVYKWAAELFGVAGGVTALLLWVSCPNVVAWSGILTIDMGATVFGLVMVYAMRGYLHKPSLERASLAAIALSLAALVKFTLLLLFPVWLAICAIVFWRRSPSITAASAAVPRHALPGDGAYLTPAGRPALAHFAFSLLVVIVAINAAYGLRGTFRRLGDYSFHCAALTRSTKESSRDVATAAAMLEKDYWARNRFRGTSFEHIKIPLPEAFVKGLDLQKSHADYGLRCYLRGRWQQRGWWYYYLYATAIKVPLGSFVVATVALFAAIASARYRTHLGEELILAAPAVLLLVVVSSQTGLDVWLRYLLPAFPFAFIAMSRVGIIVAHAFLSRHPAGNPIAQRLAASVVIACLVWNAVSVFRLHPHYLSYFNELVGGPANGWKHLVDSNIDWGQDLLLLKRWLDKHREAQPLKLAVGSGIDPHFVGLTYKLASFGPNVAHALDLPATPSELRSWGPHPGWYAVSVNCLCGMRSYTYDDDGARARLPRDAYTYFRHFKPTDHVGYSIFIYHITLAEANRVRRSLGLEELHANRTFDRRAHRSTAFIRGLRVVG